MTSRNKNNINIQLNFLATQNIYSGGKVHIQIISLEFFLRGGVDKTHNFCALNIKDHFSRFKRFFWRGKVRINDPPKIQSGAYDTLVIGC